MVVWLRISPKRILISVVVVGRMECVRQDEGDGGKLWDAMRPDKTLGPAANCAMQCTEQDHVAGGKKAVCTFLHAKGDGITANFRK